MARREAKTAMAFLSVSLGGTAVFLLLPYVDVLRRAFFRTGDGTFCGLDNFRNVLQNQAFRLAAENTGAFLLVSVPLLLVLSLAAAILMDRLIKNGRWLKTGLLIPMAIPAASAALLWRFLFHRRGFLNGLLQMAGFSGPDWMNTDAAFWVLVGSYIWKNLGFNVVLWLAGLSSVPRELYEAARLDGAGEWQLFRTITLPQLLPSALAVSILALLNSFKAFREAWLAGGEYPHESMYLMQHLFNNWFRDLSLDRMAAGAVLNSAVLICFILALQKFWDREV